MLIGQLSTGAGVPTTFNESFVPQFILVGTVDEDVPVRKLEISIGGSDFQNVNSLAEVRSLSKLQMQGMLGADVKIAQLFKIADGFIPGQNIQVRLTNNGVSTPNVYFFSQKNGSRPVSAGQETIQALSSRAFGGFSQLIFDATNLDYAQIEFNDGYSGKFETPELHARFAMMATTDADAQLAALTVIENIGDISSVTLYTTNGGVITVTKVLL